MSVVFDTSELKKLAADLAAAGPATRVATNAITYQGALNIQDQMQAEASGSASFRGVPDSITVDVQVKGDSISTSVGPEIGRGQGSLAFLAYEGDLTGGPVFPDPQSALDREATVTQESIGRAAESAL